MPNTPQGRTLKALVATSSLELASISAISPGLPAWLARAIQRLPAARLPCGHAVGATPKGRLFPLSLDDLLESAALLDAVGQEELDRIRVPPKPLDCTGAADLAEVGCREWPLDALYDCLRRAQSIAAEPERVRAGRADARRGLSTRRGPARCYLHYDAVNRILRGRAGPAVPKIAAGHQRRGDPGPFDYEVLLHRRAIGRHPAQGLCVRKHGRRHRAARQPELPHPQGRNQQGAGRRPRTACRRKCRSGSATHRARDEA